MRNNQIRAMTFYAMFIAIIALLSFTSLGYIPLSPAVSVTIIHIIVILAGLLMGFRGGLVTGVAFGVLSWIRAITAPVGVVDPVFANVLVSILPRVLFGLVAGGFGVLVHRIVNHLEAVAHEKGTSVASLKAQETIVIIIEAAVATLFHTAFVLPLMYFVGRQMPIYAEYFSDLKLSIFFFSILGANGVLEIAAAAIITPILYFALKRFFKNTFSK